MGALDSIMETKETRLFEHKGTRIIRGIPQFPGINHIGRTSQDAETGGAALCARNCVDVS